MAELRAEVTGLQTELGESIRGRPDDVARTVQEVHQIRIIVHAVENEIVLLGALTIGDKVSGTRATSILKRRRDAGRQLRDINPVPSIQWCIVDLLGADHLTDSGILGLQQWRCGCNT